MPHIRFNKFMFAAVLLGSILTTLILGIGEEDASWDSMLIALPFAIIGSLIAGVVTGTFLDRHPPQPELPQPKLPQMHHRERPVQINTSATGMSRVLFEIRDEHGNYHPGFLLVSGSYVELDSDSPYVFYINGVRVMCSGEITETRHNPDL